MSEDLKNIHAYRPTLYSRYKFTDTCVMLQSCPFRCVCVCVCECVCAHVCVRLTSAFQYFTLVLIYLHFANNLFTVTVVVDHFIYLEYIFEDFFKKI